MSRNHDPKHICFIAHSAYDAIVGGKSGHHIGGIERQTALMAQWFASKRYRVSVITWDEGQKDGTEIDGVRIFKMCRPEAGLPGLRFLWPRWSSLIAAMSRVDADLYYYNCGDLGLGQVAMWCLRHGKKSVYSVACELDCDSKLPRLEPLRERWLYRYGLKHVDEIIVQTNRQQQLLKEGFGINSIAIPMPCEDHNANSPVNHKIADDKRGNVLWVGRISEEKRFECLLDIAELCPTIMFNVIGLPNSSSHYSSMLMKRAEAITNVEMHGYVPHYKMAMHYLQATVLCCTSIYEGFPNTFLEAWSCGIPVVSTFDPDGVISKNNLGWSASSIEQLVAAIQELVKDKKKWRDASESSRNYYLKNHTLNSCMVQFERVIKDVFNR